MHLVDLTPRDIHDRRFHDAFRGYNQEEVDLFLDDVAASFEEVFRENQTFHHRLKDLEGQLSEARATEDMLKQMLVAAQKTATEAVEAARSQAEGLISDAEARRIEILAEAEGRASEIVNHALSRQREAAATIENLRSFDRQHRERLRAFMEAQIRALGELGLFSPPPEDPPEAAPPAEPLEAQTESLPVQMPETPDAGPQDETELPGAATQAYEPGVSRPPMTEAYERVATPAEDDLPEPQAAGQPGAPEAGEEAKDRDQEPSIDELFWGERKR